MFGRTLLPGSTIQPTRVSSDGAPFVKTGGVSIDWSTVTAPGSDTTLADGSVVKSGSKFLRYGQVITKITSGTVQTLTGTATGGTFTLSITRPDNQQVVTTGTIAAAATAATVLTAVQAVLGPGQAVSATGGALGTNPVVLNFSTAVGLATVNGALLTGGTVTNVLTTAALTGGYFGPYDPAASDGRQTLTRGECFILDELLLQYGVAGSGLMAANDHVGGAIEGGSLWLDRILQSGTVTHTLALGPTKAEVLTAFPAIRLVEN